MRLLRGFRSASGCRRNDGSEPGGVTYNGAATAGSAAYGDVRRPSRMFLVCQYLVRWTYCPGGKAPLCNTTPSRCSRVDESYSISFCCPRCTERDSGREYIITKGESALMQFVYCVTLYNPTYGCRSVFGWLYNVILRSLGIGTVSVEANLAKCYSEGGKWLLGGPYHSVAQA